MIKLVVPLSNIRYYEKLMKDGAGEFFAGFVPYEWLNQYGMINPINRREYMLGSSQICSMDAMVMLSEYVKYYGVKVKIAINSHYYLDEQYPVILDIIEKLTDLGFDEFIVADLYLVILIRERHINCKIHMSGEIETLNHYTIDFLGKLDINRIVFPRKISLDDMQNCIKLNHTNIKEYEAFILNSLCKYSGGFCNSIHCDNLTATCSIPYVVQTYKDEKTVYTKFVEQINKRLSKNSIKNAIYHNCKFERKHIVGKTGCGICQVKKLNNIGITHLKIVGRGYDIDRLSHDIKFMSDIVKISYDMTEDEFVNTVKVQYINHDCSKCYYPLRND